MLETQLCRVAVNNYDQEYEYLGRNINVYVIVGLGLWCLIPRSKISY